MGSKTCIFCDILQESLPAAFVYRGEKCSAFMDIHPINDGHLLVVPNRHVERFSQLDETEVRALFSVGQDLLKALLNSSIRCEGSNLLISDGPSAGQEVEHTHLHIIPRFKGDGQKVGFRHSGLASVGDLDQIAKKISSKGRDND